MLHQLINKRCLLTEAAITALGRLGVAGVTAAASMYNNARQRQEQRELMQKSIDENIMQWNRENQYNTPASQMSRFSAAGLNPNLIYGQSNTASSMTPSADVPDSKMPHNSVVEGLSAMQSAKQMELMDAQIANLRQNAQTNAAREQAILHGMSLDDQRLQIMWQRLDQDGQRLADDIARNAHLNDKTDEERKLITEQILTEVEHRNQIVKSIEVMDVEKAGYVLDNIKKKFDNEHLQETFDMVKKETYSRIAKNYSEKNLNDSKKREVDQQIDWLERTLGTRLQKLSNEVDLQNMEYARGQQQLRQMKADLIASLDDVYRNSRMAIDLPEADEFDITKDNSRPVITTALDIALQSLGFSSGYYSGSHSTAITRY